MNNRSFLQGLMAGGLVGALVGVAATPHRRPEPQPGFLRKTTRAGYRAQKLIRDVQAGLQDIKKILDYQ